MNTRRAWLLRAAFAALAVVASVAWLPPALAAGVAAGIVLLVAVAAPAPIAAASARNSDAETQQAVSDELARLIAPLAEGVLLLDAQHSVVAANPAAARIVDRPLESMLSASLIAAVRDHDVAEVARAATGAPVPVHISAAGHDVLATASMVEAGSVRTLVVLEDVTELERARRARAELVANMSHELRTPVAAARALAETLQSGVDDASERARFVDRLAEEVARLGAMVERLLRLSRLESGSEVLTPEALDPAALLATAASRIEPLAGQRNISIEVLPSSAPLVNGDGDRVLEVLSNLLENALRYAPDGSRVALLAERQDGDPVMVRFEVDDEGPGILPMERERVFERFYTGDRARVAGDGTGLGLAIARHIVQRLGGRIWVADRTPGATLCFTLPLAVDGASAADAPPVDRSAR
jgi:two-component system, OmpR family, phosphate regulon sensor histidine kinase PhoR